MMKIENYILEECLGKGSFGEVYLTTLPNDPNKYATKLYDRAVIENSEAKKYLENEIKILRLLNHPNIIKCYSVFRDPNNKYIYFIMELMNNGDLESFKEAFQNLKTNPPERILWKIFYDCLKGLTYIHDEEIIHRDIKPRNLFFDEHMKIKIGDFGLATRYSTSKLLRANKIEGTPLYLSPEQTTFKSYNEKVDIYACGITLYEMCSCFYTSMERYESITNLRNNEIIDEKVVKNYPEETELIKLMTKKDYNERPTANEILKSDLFINLGKKLGF